jgi:hypothetical protein
MQRLMIRDVPAAQPIAGAKEINAVQIEISCLKLRP